MFLSSKTLCTYTTLSNFCKVTASLLKWFLSVMKKCFLMGQWILQNDYSNFSHADYSWLIKFERHLMALRTNDQFWNSIPTIKQSLIFYFLKESCICWHISFNFLWTSSIIINWCTLHRRVHGAVSTWRSTQTWNEVIAINHQEYIKWSIKL